MAQEPRAGVETYRLADCCPIAMWDALFCEDEARKQTLLRELGLRRQAALMEDGAVSPIEARRPSALLIAYAVRQIMCTAPGHINDTTFFKRLAHHTGGKGKPHNLKPSVEVRCVRRDETARTDVPDYVQDAITAVINEWRGAPNLPLRTIDIFANSKIIGPDALRRLRQAISPPPPRQKLRSEEARHGLDATGWLLKPDSFGGDPFKFKMKDGDGREAALQLFREAVFAANSRRQLINGFQSGMRGGLTAFAKSLIDQDARRELGSRWPIFYIPLHGRTRKTPEDTYPQLVAMLSRFYQAVRDEEYTITHMLGMHSAAPTTDGASLPPGPSQDTVSAIQELRRIMAEHPAIIIFDGYRVPRLGQVNDDCSLSHLHRAIEDDDLFTLIERLVEPPTPTKDDPIDLALFRENKFVVLSDHRLYEKKDNNGAIDPADRHPALKSIAGESIKIPLPHSDLMPELIEIFRFRAPALIQWLRADVGRQKLSAADISRFETEFEAHTQQLIALSKQAQFKGRARSESTYGVLSTLLSLGAPGQYDIAPATTKDARILNELIDRHLLVLLHEKKYQQWRTFLEFIALAPGGLRPKTLRRLYQAYHEAMHPQTPCPSAQTLNASIIDMLVNCSGVLGVHRSDQLEALHERPLPLIHLGEIVHGEIATDRAIQYSVPELQDAIAKHIGAGAANDHTPQSIRSLMHLIMAEEAYEQFTSLARYDDTQTEHGLRRQRRLLECLFHGIASLCDQSLSHPLANPEAAQFLPSDPHRRWVKLYSVVFRRALDQAPAYSLSRYYAAEHVKYEILLALSNPQICWGEPVSKQQQYPRLDGAHQATLLEFQNDFYSAAFSAGIEPPLRHHALHANNRPARLPDRSVNWRFEKRLLDIETARLGQVQDEKLDLYLSLRDKHVVPHLHSLLKGKADFGELLSESVQRTAEKISDNFGETRGDWTRELVMPEGLPRDELAALIDLLNRYGELTGVKADLEDAVRKAQGGPDAIPTSPDVKRGFRESFAAYTLADRFRRQLFWTNPIAQEDVMGGHATRSYIRSALKLERIAISAANTVPTPLGPGWFWRRAHTIADELTRHLSRYPRERAGMLILESTLTRYYVPRQHAEYPQRVANALECLRVAEPIVLRLGMHTRLRLRFALERNKVLRELARIDIESHNNRLTTNSEHFLALAEADVRVIRELSEDNLDRLWQTLATLQQEKIQQLRA